MYAGEIQLAVTFCLAFSTALDLFIANKYALLAEYSDQPMGEFPMIEELKIVIILPNFCWN